MKVYTHGFGFMEPYIRMYCDLVTDAREAGFVLTMNNAGATQVVEEAREIAHGAGKALCWWTIEDPNAVAGFMPQAKLADFVFTSDKACIPHYRRHCGHDRVFWLPLAACEELHKPMPLAEDAADFVFSGNWYDRQWQARRWGVATVILPLAEAGYSMAIFSYEEPPYDILKPFWRGGTSCYTVAEQYTHGKVVLGVNNQRTGMDARGVTYMTSMRTFEALACGKPFLASHSDAYEALGFRKVKHFIWLDSSDMINSATLVLLSEDIGPAIPGGPGISKAGREFVLAHHTYGHRLQRIAKAIAGEAGPETWE